MKKMHVSRLVKVACAVAAGGLSFSAGAATFDYDNGLTVRIDSTVSLGVAVRVEEQDPNLIGFANQTADGEQGRAYSVNGDDGNLAFEQGDIVGSAFKWTSDMTAYWGDFSLFVRGSYIYDPTLNNKDYFDEDDFSGSDTQDADDLAAKRRRVRTRVGHDADLLDAYVSGDFDVFGRFLSLRIGRQVLNWGESSFELNGLNSLEALDANQARVPGFDVSELFKPNAMVWGSLDLTDYVAVEGFYQWDWQKTDPDASGTYLSTNDFAARGGTAAQLGFGRAPENAAPFTPCFGVDANGNATQPTPANQCVPFGAGIPRDPDQEPENGEQFGGALRMYVPVLNDMDLAFYGANYHSRLPLFSGVGRPNLSATTQAARYFVVYPEDIKLYGLSLSTSIPLGLSLQAEYSLKSDQPLQIDDVELLLAGLGNPSQVAPVQGSVLGREIVGFRRFDVHQWNVGLTRIFGPGFLGNDQATVLLEVAGMSVDDFPTNDELRLEGPGTYLPGSAIDAAVLGVPQQQAGYPTSTSWGYNLAARFTYNNVFNRFVVEPSILFQHDVNGISPTPLTNFVEDRKQLNAQITGRYLDAWEAQFGYVGFFGAGRQNLLLDRDYVQASIKYSF